MRQIGLCFSYRPLYSIDLSLQGEDVLEVFLDTRRSVCGSIETAEEIYITYLTGTEGQLRLFLKLPLFAQD